MTWFSEAIEFLCRSVDERGATVESAFALALAHHGRRDLDEAARWLAEALAIDPGFAPARTLRVVLETETRR
jgi:hypothetical protein